MLLAIAVVASVLLIVNAARSWNTPVRVYITTLTVTGIVGMVGLYLVNLPIMVGASLAECVLIVRHNRQHKAAHHE